MAKAFDELLAFMQQKGFIWGPEPELYGGLSGFYTYAPLGKLLKNKVEEQIRQVFTKNDFWEVECPIIMQREVWKASGHLDGFCDPLIICSKCKSNFRADNLINELFPDTKVEEYIDFIEKKHIKCPNCKGEFIKELKTHNLMMKTTVGLDIEAFNRPETATTTYLPFIRYFDYFRKKIPFGVFQIGKAFRNEISPRQHVLRQREFTQAEAQLFIFGDQKNHYHLFEKFKHDKLKVLSEHQQKSEHPHDPEIISCEDAYKLKLFKNKAYLSMVAVTSHMINELGFPADKLRLRQHWSDEKAFYADDAWDVEIQTRSFGWIELGGIHDRTQYDLKQHMEHSKKSLTVTDEQHKDEIPHIIEIAIGVDRIVFCLLDLFYEKKEKDQGKTVLRIPKHLAPVQCTILPLVNKENLPELAQEIYQELKQEFICKYDDSGSIGKRYLREEEIGTPLCVTIDFDTKEKGTVTVRERETGKQVIVDKERLKVAILEYFFGKPIEDIGTLLTKNQETIEAS
jgi:glycyl-tRNA synthetase